MSDNSVSVRGLVKTDIPTLVEISAETDYPWLANDFRRVIKRPSTAGFVVLLDGVVIGFMILSVENELFRLLDVTISSDYRYGAKYHCKAGRKLVGFLTDQLIPTGRKCVIADVRESNLAAQLFLKACGFKATGVTRKFFPDNCEDSYKFEYRHSWPKKKLG